MITLTASKPLPNFTRWEVTDWEAYEKRGYGMATVAIRSAGPTDYTVTKQIFIRNVNPAQSASGLTDRVRYAAVVGGAIADQLVVDSAALSLPTGFDDAMNAYLSGVGGRQARLNALASFLLTAQIADSTLAGS